MIALAATDPTNAIWQSEVIDSHQAVAKVLAAMQRTAEAATELQAALDLAEAVSKKDPTVTMKPTFAV